jgi:non-specific protein-tyrosine kinase
VPFIRGLARQPLIVDRGTQASLAEAFRQLRTNLYFSPGATQGTHHANTVNATLVNVVVTSSLSGEGTTSTLCNLAIAEAEAGRKVMVIDANLRSPGVIGLFGLETGPGLVEVLTGGTTLASAIQTWRRAGTNIDVLPSGASPARPSDLLSSRAMISLLASVRSRYHLVLIDTPPLLPVTDAAAVAPHADGVLLVVQYGKTQADQIETATDALDAVSGVLVGTVISMVPSTSPRIRLERSKNPRTGAHSADEPRAVSGASEGADPAGSPEPALSPEPAESPESAENLEPARSLAADRLRPKPKTPAPPTPAGRRRMLS